MKNQLFSESTLIIFKFNLGEIVAFKFFQLTNNDYSQRSTHVAELCIESERLVKSLTFDDGIVVNLVSLLFEFKHTGDIFQFGIYPKR